MKKRREARTGPVGDTLARVNIAHVSMLNKPLGESPGFKAQLQDEYDAATLLVDQGVAWRTFLLAPEENDETYEGFDVPVIRLPSRRTNRLMMRLCMWQFVRAQAKESDIVLVRHQVVDPWAPYFLARMKNVREIHHTKSAEELAAVGHPLLALIERAILAVNRRVAAPGIGVTHELTLYATGPWVPESNRRLAYPNGVSIGPSDPVSDKRDMKSLEVAFVASSFERWHGLERLMASAEHFVSTEQIDIRRKPLIVHLVGYVSDEQRERATHISTPNLQFVCHGKLAKKELEEILAKSTLGISSLALDLQGMREACTLKVREYLKAGLPVYATHHDSGFPDSFVYFSRSREADIEELWTLAEKSLNYSRDQVRDAAIPFIEKRNIMRVLANELIEGPVEE